MTRLSPGSSRVEAKKALSFLKKRNKKLFEVLSQASPAMARQRSKSFLVLFFKKELVPEGSSNALPSLPQLHLSAPPPPLRRLG
jgi:hypothetical protein